MAQSPLRFRCYQCNKMLGVSPSKAGRVVTCPSCQSELIVPEAGSSVQPAETPIDIGIRTAPEHVPSDEPPTAIMTEATSSRPIFPPEPPTTVDGSDLPATLADFEGLGIEVPEPGPSLVERPYEPILEREGRVRSRDVVLPRGVVAAWSLLVLLAVFAAFAAGLLTGHYVWKGPGFGASSGQDKR